MLACALLLAQLGAQAHAYAHLASDTHGAPGAQLCGACLSIAPLQGAVGPPPIVVPLDLRDPTGLAILACIVTSTPGTAWVEYSSTESKLLLHVFDLVDEAYWIDLIKNRYERLLLDILT